MMNNRSASSRRGSASTFVASIAVVAVVVAAVSIPRADASVLHGHDLSNFQDAYACDPESVRIVR